jgi:hypothetical protein
MTDDYQPWTSRVTHIPADHPSIQLVSAQARKALKAHPTYGSHTVVKDMLGKCGEHATYSDLIQYAAKDTHRQKNRQLLADAIYYAAGNQFGFLNKILGGKKEDTFVDATARLIQEKTGYNPQDKNEALGFV